MTIEGSKTDTNINKLKKLIPNILTDATELDTEIYVVKTEINQIGKDLADVWHEAGDEARRILARWKAGQ